MTTEPQSPPSAPEAEDADTLAELLARLEAQWGTDPHGCLALVPRAEALADRLDDRHARMRTSYVTGVVHTMLADDATSLAAMDHAVRLARELEDRTWEARILTGLAGTHHGFGDYTTAIDLLEEALAIRQEIGDVPGTAAILGNLGQLLVHMGSMPGRARALLEEGRELFAALGNAMGEAACLLYLVKLDLGEAEAARETDPERTRTIARAAAVAAAEAARLADAAGTQAQLTGSCLTEQARALLLTGDLAGAQHLTDEAATWFATLDLEHLTTELVVVRTRLERARGQHAEAVGHLERALTLARQHRRTADALTLLAELVDTEDERGRSRTALRHHRELHALTLKHRAESAEQRARAMNEKRDLDRARLEAEMERLRSEQLETANRVLAHESRHDGLTGVANRRAVDEELAARTARTARTASGDRPGLACVVADLDRFKDVNDEHSHLVGDDVLREVARILSGAVRDADLVGRLGGEEFVLLLGVDGTPDGGVEPLDGALEGACERMRAAVEQHPWDRLAPGLRVTMSVGAARLRPGESASELLARADALMYRAKRAGRNRVVTDTT